jgi:Tol biopolymer transport system component
MASGLPATTGLIGPSAPAAPGSWSPDGKTLMFWSSERTTEANETRLYTIPAPGGQPVLLLPYKSEWEYIGPHDPDWSPVP